MTLQADLVLRDIHVPPPPPWWPPAPGWWLLAGLLAVLAGLAAWWQLRRRRRRRALARLFDETVSGAGSPAEQLAAISGLLRRAARQRDPASATLRGEAWLQHLDAGLPEPVFAAAPGRALLDGAYRPDASQADAEAVLGPARDRFLDWMGASR